MRSLNPTLSALVFLPSPPLSSFASFLLLFRLSLIAACRFATSSLSRPVDLHFGTTLKRHFCPIELIKIYIFTFLSFHINNQPSFRRFGKVLLTVFERLLMRGRDAHPRRTQYETHGAERSSLSHGHPFLLPLQALLRYAKESSSSNCYIRNILNEKRIGYIISYLVMKQ